MDLEKRICPRFLPDDLIANITVKPPLPDEEIIVEGKIIDMSYTGIKIKLNTPFPANIDCGEIRIEMTLPQSSISVSIHGVIKHRSNECEYGLQFADKHGEHDVDNLMFECIKLSGKSVQV